MTAVLVVEDDTLIASSLARVLRSRGYDVTTARTVREAMASTESGPPDLVLPRPDHPGEGGNARRSSSAPLRPIMSGSATRRDASSTVNSLRSRQSRTMSSRSAGPTSGARSMTVRSAVVHRIPWTVVTSLSGTSS